MPRRDSSKQADKSAELGRGRRSGVRKLSELSYAWTDYPGPGADPFTYYPILRIDDTPLIDMLNEARAKKMRQPVELSRNLIPAWGWARPEDRAEAFQRLTLQGPPDLPGKRRSVLVCPCGALACGAISAEIAWDDYRPGTIVWRDFGHQSSLDDPDVEELGPWETFRGVGPFYFDYSHYEVALERLDYTFLAEYWRGGSWK